MANKHARLFLLVSIFLSGVLCGSAVMTVQAEIRKGSAVFSDVEQNAYYDEAIGELNALGIIRGYADGRFGPNDSVTRGQVAVLLQRLRQDLLGENLEPSQAGSTTQPSSAPPASSTPPATLNDEGKIRFTTSTYHVDENAGTVTISLVRAGGSVGSVSIDLETENSTAEAGKDYDAASETLTFADGETTRTVTMEILNDTEGEVDQSFRLVLSNPTGGLELSTPSTATVIIKDDDGAPTGSSTPPTSGAAGIIGFDAIEYSADEKGGSISVTLVRSTGSSGIVKVDYATTDSTAKSGSDYTQTSGTATFAAGEKVAVVSVPLLDDTDVEGNETITLTLSNPQGGARLATLTSAPLIIFDTDVQSVPYGSGALRFVKANYEASESDGKVEITVRRSGGADGEVSVSFTANGGSATKDKDYTQVSGVLLFRNGESLKSFFVPILSDNELDSEETVNMTLSNVTGSATLGSPATATITIFD